MKELERAFAVNLVVVLNVTGYLTREKILVGQCHVRTDMGSSSDTLCAVLSGLCSSPYS